MTEISQDTKRRLKDLDQGKTKSLGLFERIAMKYAGRSDGRKGLLRCTDGEWHSSFLKGEIDAYEEYCAAQVGYLKIAEEELFQQINTQFDRIPILRRKLDTAKQHLTDALNTEPDTSRRDGEEELSNGQVVSRRHRERERQLARYRSEVDAQEKELSDAVDDVFCKLSRIREAFDSCQKVLSRVRQHSQRRIDIYWRTASKHLPELPAVPDVAFSNKAEQTFVDHFNDVSAQAEALRSLLAAKI